MILKPGRVGAGVELVVEFERSDADEGAVDAEVVGSVDGGGGGGPDSKARGPVGGALELRLLYDGPEGSIAGVRVRNEKNKRTKVDGWWCRVPVTTQHTNSKSSLNNKL